MSETYRHFHLIYDEPPPIPSRACDWSAYHDDYDGAPDGGDDRVFFGPTKEDVMAQVDEWHEQEPAAVRAHDKTMVAHAKLQALRAGRVGEGV